MGASNAAQLEVELATLDRHVRHAGKPVVVVWAVLMVATLVCWWLGDGHGTTTLAAMLVIATAFMKVSLIGEHFMELRGAPPQLRFAFLGWCVLIPTILITMYLVRR